MSGPRRRGQARVATALSTLVGLVVAAAFLAPIAWAVLASFRPAAEAALPPLPPWPTGGSSLEAYRRLDGSSGGLWLHAANSGLVAGATVVLSVVISLFAGYGFSRYRFPLRNTCFVLVMTTMMVPFQSILVPLFILLTHLHLQNTLAGLTLVYVTLQLPFSISMMRNAFDAVPREIEEAARIDGVRDLRLLVRVLLPLVMPGVATVAIFAFLNSWNEFLAALIFLSDETKFTLPVLMTAVRAGRFGSIDWGAVQAGVTVMMIPCLVVFLALQRFYIRGLTAGAVK